MLILIIIIIQFVVGFFIYVYENSKIVTRWSPESVYEDLRIAISIVPFFFCLVLRHHLCMPKVAPKCIIFDSMAYKMD